MGRKRKRHSEEYIAYLNSQEWALTRAKALAAGRHRCALCHSAFDLHVHHATYERLGHEDPGDLVVLCGPCHKRHHDCNAAGARKITKAERQEAHKRRNAAQHIDAVKRAEARNARVGARVRSVQSARPSEPIVRGEVTTP
jgi:5-methylcytosine-specific restriction endonuclease McrA